MPPFQRKCNSYFKNMMMISLMCGQIDWLVKYALCECEPLLFAYLKYTVPICKKSQMLLAFTGALTYLKAIVLLFFAGEKSV